MARFCTKCGAPLNEQSAFCTTCGAPNVPVAPEAAPIPAAPVVQNVPPVQQNTVPVSAPVAPKSSNFFTDLWDKVQKFCVNFIEMGKKDPKVFIVPGAILVGVIVLIVVLSLVLGGGGYKSVLNDYCDLLEGNAAKIEKMAPKEYWEWYEDEYDDSVDDLIDEFEEYYEDDIIDMLEDELGDNIKVSYEIKKEKELKDKVLEGIAEGLDDQYDIDAKVTKGYDLKIKMTIEGSDDDESSTLELSVVKINGKWYLINYYEYDDEYRVSFAFNNMF